MTCFANKVKCKPHINFKGHLLNSNIVEHLIDLYSVTTWSNLQDMRIKEIITTDKSILSWCLNLSHLQWDHEKFWKELLKRCQKPILWVWPTLIFLLRGTNSSFYSCVFSNLALSESEAGSSLCFDANLAAFHLQIMLNKNQLAKEHDNSCKKQEGLYQNKTTSFSLPLKSQVTKQTTVNWAILSEKFFLSVYFKVVPLSIFFWLHTLKDIRITLTVVILNSNTLSGTKLWILIPNSYKDHPPPPCLFYMRVFCSPVNTTAWATNEYIISFQSGCNTVVLMA